jgi:hypothetical protein
MVLWVKELQVPRNVLSPQVRGKAGRSEKYSIPIPKGSVLAYKKQQLVIENNTCGEQQWGPGGDGVSKDVYLFWLQARSTPHCPRHMPYLQSPLSMAILIYF